MIQKPNFFIFTGGPGVGKTALIRHLERLGERVVEETARAVIREHAESAGLDAEPIDPAIFIERTSARDIAAFDGMVDENARVFFDRGIGDCWNANGVAPSPALIEAVRTRRYNRSVFVFPPWREIYRTDAERKQDWAEAEATFGRVLEAYGQMGYEAVVVPKGDVAARAAFVLARARLTP